MCNVRSITNGALELSSDGKFDSGFRHGERFFRNLGFYGLLERVRIHRMENLIGHTAASEDRWRMTLSIVSSSLTSADTYTSNAVREPNGAGLLPSFFRYLMLGIYPRSTWREIFTLLEIILMFKIV